MMEDNKSSDLFVSYAREDLSRVLPIVDSVENAGYEVFWDQKILPGDDWRAVLEFHLARATHVLVVWTQISVASRWVKEEAQEAIRLHKYFPIQLEPCKLPLGFRSVHTIELCDDNYAVVTELIQKSPKNGDLQNPSLLKREVVTSISIVELSLPNKNKCTKDDLEAILSAIGNLLTMDVNEIRIVRTK